MVDIDVVSESENIFVVVVDSNQDDMISTYFVDQDFFLAIKLLHLYNRNITIILQGKFDNDLRTFIHINDFVAMTLDQVSQ